MRHVGSLVGAEGQGARGGGIVLEMGTFGAQAGVVLEDLVEPANMYDGVVDVELGPEPLLGARAHNGHVDAPLESRQGGFAQFNGQ